MKIELKFAELHTPLFLKGKNHQMKLYSGEKHPETRLFYEREEKELHVYFHDEVAIVPCSNVASMQPTITPELPKIELKAAPPPVVKGPIKAQVSTPHDHVFKK